MRFVSDDDNLGWPFEAFENVKKILLSPERESIKSPTNLPSNRLYYSTSKFGT